MRGPWRGRATGLKKADKLYQAGFRSIQEIQAASDEQLLEVEGIGKGLVKKLRGPETARDSIPFLGG